MSQLIWMIDLIPNWFWTIVLWAGIVSVAASYIAGKLPFVAQYKILLRVGGVIATLIGVYFYGVIANEAKWAARVDELQRQVKEAEVEGDSANKKLAEALDNNKRIAQTKGKEIVKYVDKWRTKEILKEVQGPEKVRVEEVIKYVENCPVPKEFIDIHNKSATKPTGDNK